MMTSSIVMNKVVVRDAKKPELPRIIELIQLGALGTSVEKPEELAPYERAFDVIEMSGSSLLVAEVDGEIVGTLQLIVFQHLQYNGGLCGELESVHVHPDWRNHGVGGVLVEAALARAQAQGCYRVQLTSNSQRSDAHRFYENHGFAKSHQGFKRFLSPPD